MRCLRTLIILALTVHPCHTWSASGHHMIVVLPYALLPQAEQQQVLQLPAMLAAAAQESLKNFVRAETERHCREVLHATATRLEVAEMRGAYAYDTDDEPRGDDSKN